MRRSLRKELLIGKGESKKGILQMGLENIFQWNKSSKEDKFSIRLSSSIVCCSRAVDLLRSTKEDAKYSKDIKETKDLIEMKINDKYDVKRVLKIIAGEIIRADPELGAEDIENIGHFLISIRLYRESEKKGVYSQVDLVKLAGSECTNSNSPIVNQFVIGSFNALSNELLAISSYRSGERKHFILLPMLERTLNFCSRVLVVVCADTSSEQFKESLGALNFISQVRKSILSKKCEHSVQEINTEHSVNIKELKTQTKSISKKNTEKGSTIKEKSNSNEFLKTTAEVTNVINEEEKELNVNNKMDNEIKVSKQKCKKDVKELIERVDSLERELMNSGDQKKMLSELHDKNISLLKNENEANTARYENRIAELIDTIREKEKEIAEAKKLGDKIKDKERQSESLKEQEKVRIESENNMKQLMDDKLKKAIEHIDTKHMQEVTKLQAEFKESEENLKEDIKRLKAKLKEEKSINEALQGKLNNSKKEIDSIKEHIEVQVASSSKELAQEKIRHEAELAAKGQEIRSMKETNSELKNKLERQNIKIHSFESEINKLVQSKQDLNKKISEYEIELEEMKKKHVKSKEHIQNLKEELNSKTIEIENIKKAFKEAINEKERSTKYLLEEKDTLLQNVREKYEKMKAENEELKVNSARLLKKIAEQGGQIEELQVQIEIYAKESKQDLSLIENKYEVMDSELKQLTERRLELTQQERKYRKNITELEQTNKELLDKYTEAREKKRKYKTKLVEAERKLKGLELKKLVLDTNPLKENIKSQPIVMSYYNNRI